MFRLNFWRIAAIQLVFALATLLLALPGVLWKDFPFLLQLLLALVSTLLTYWVWITMADWVEKTVNGQSCSLGGSLQMAATRCLPLFGTGFLAGLILMGLSLLLIVPGIIWSVYYAFFIYVVALRNTGGKRALDYSKKLVAGQWWRVAEVGLGIALVIAVPGFLLMVPTSLLLNTSASALIVAGVLLYLVAMVLVSSLSLVLMGVFFLNLDYLQHPPKRRAAKH